MKFKKFEYIKKEKLHISLLYNEPLDKSFLGVTIGKGVFGRKLFFVMDLFWKEVVIFA